MHNYELLGFLHSFSSYMIEKIQVDHYQMLVNLFQNVLTSTISSF